MDGIIINIPLKVGLFNDQIMDQHGLHSILNQMKQLQLERVHEHLSFLILNFLGITVYQ